MIQKTSGSSKRIHEISAVEMKILRQRYQKKEIKSFVKSNIVSIENEDDLNSLVMYRMVRNIKEWLDICRRKDEQSVIKITLGETVN